MTRHKHPALSLALLALYGPLRHNGRRWYLRTPTKEYSLHPRKGWRCFTLH
jgi:hypothetical protein